MPDPFSILLAVCRRTREAMAGPQEVPRHRRTHVAEPDETYVHLLILFGEDRST
jgi:hypothetical protein